MFERSTMDARQHQAPTHECVSRDRCRAATIDDQGQWQPQLTEHPRTMCDACRKHHTAAIKQIPRDWAELLVTIGDRQAARGDVVHSTPSPAVLLNATNDRLMVDIAEWTDIAAAIIADRRNMTKPTGAHRLPLVVDPNDGKKKPAQVGSIALRTWDWLSSPRAWPALSDQHTMIINNLDTLAAEPATPVRVWSHPERCEPHATAIWLAAEQAHHSAEPEDRSALERARLAAALCDACNGWGPKGQARTTINISGIQILQKLVTLHHLTRKHLGYTKLRHTYTMPCPRCGYPTGRDDGTTIITCDNDNCTPRGRSSWSERDYDWLTGRVIEGNTEMWLTKEAYHRLDRIQDLIDTLDGDDTINLPGAGPIIIEQLQSILSEGKGHPRPADREPSTDRTTAAKSQAADDKRTWQSEPRYKKPKPKVRTEPRDDIPKIAQSSRSMLTDDGGLYPDEYAIGSHEVCGTCHLTRPCDCEA